jgi:quercetin dioxygenase-like cupin family protein
MRERAIGNLDEVLDNLGVFRAIPEDLLQLCTSGFRRIPISQGDEFYLSLQAFAPHQPAYAHTHPDSEEWVVVLRGSGEARIHGSIPLAPGVMLGRAAEFPHGFTSGDEEMLLLSIQVPRPAEGATTWDEPGGTTDPIRCAAGGHCRRCPRCAGHSAERPGDVYACENCSLVF